MWRQVWPSVALAVLAFGVSAGSAPAVTLNLDTDDPPEGQSDFQNTAPGFPPDIGFLENGDRAVAGDFGITFENVETPPNDPQPPGGGVDEDGIFFGRTGDLEVVSVDLIFDVPTVILSYDIDFVGDAVAFEAEFFDNRSSFQLSGPNGTSGQNFFDTEGDFSFDMGTIPFFAPGVAYTLTHTVPDFGPGLAGFDFITQIDEFEVTAVPLPMPAAMLLTGLALLGWRARRG
ncbi:MAG: hypothetical protein AAFR79_13000 [Pseudomonadota bacterium]